MRVPKIPGAGSGGGGGAGARARQPKPRWLRSLILAGLAVAPPLAYALVPDSAGPGAARTFADVHFLPQHRAEACPRHDGESGCRLSDFLAFYGLSASADRALAGRLRKDLRAADRFDGDAGINVKERRICPADSGPSGDDPSDNACDNRGI